MPNNMLCRIVAKRDKFKLARSDIYVDKIDIN